ncbi:MAG TPA: cupin domain-containing protein [Bryobacteraceae bacterium]|jgi:quercetin dioxygenase-like cupin family protein
MEPSRREVALLLSFLTASAAETAENSFLPSRCYDFNSLPVKKNSKTGAESRQVFHGTTHDGFPIDLHITTMPPGQMPHPAHHHEHEEMMLVQQGSLEATISGKTTVVGPGSVVYIHSNEEHGLKCTGDIPAQYFVLALGRQTSA